jgi:uncharacterized protein (DUF1501 family)
VNFIGGRSVSMLSRRGFLTTGSAAWFTLSCAPGVAFAGAETDRRLVYIVLRGGMDGLEALMPVGDPAWSGIGGRQDPLGEPVPVDGFFHLHANLAPLAPLARSGELLFVHAISSPYRERSHFDAQNIIESGGRRAYELKDGLLARLVAAIGGDAGTGVAATPDLPMSLRGDIPFGNYVNARLGMPPQALQDRLTRLWAGDSDLGGTWEQVQRAARILSSLRGGTRAQVAGHMLAHPEGPRVAVLETGGFDTHSSQKYRLGSALTEIERIILQLRAQLGPAWASTVVVAATEFGRTIEVNGAGGTDHGTGTLAFVAGGVLPAWGIRGPVIADWPGVATPRLLDNRDLKPTRDLRGLLLAIAARQFGKDPAQLSPSLFPGEERVRPDPTFV